MERKNSYQLLRKGILFILYVLLAYAIYQVIRASLQVYTVIQSDSLSSMELMTYSFYTENSLISIGLSIEVAKMIVVTLYALQKISSLIFIFLMISLFKNVIQENTPYSENNFKKIKFIVILYLGIPLLQNIFNCIIAFHEEPFEIFMNQVANFAGLLFISIIILFIISSFQHGIFLQHEADETL